MRAAVEMYCARIGADRLLVQGAGGNVSWKDDGVLWVKASGTRIGEALQRDIFVGVDLARARTSAQPVSLTQRTDGGCPAPLRPSIETQLHALLPQRVVVHLHAVEALVHLVQLNDVPRLAALLYRPDIAYVPYARPGAPLAEALQRACASRPSATIFLLANHGIVVAGDSVGEVEERTAALLSLLKSEPRSPAVFPAPRRAPAGMRLPRDEALHSLAFDEPLLSLMRSTWAITPDHAVFLGPEAPIFSLATEAGGDAGEMPLVCPLLIIPALGTFVREGSDALGAEAMLRCYLDVALRLPGYCQLRALDPEEVAGLMGWEAEAHRRAMSSTTHAGQH